IATGSSQSQRFINESGSLRVHISLLIYRVSSEVISRDGILDFIAGVLARTTVRFVLMPIITVSNLYKYKSIRDVFQLIL
ncbi:hypothetical protein PSHT_05670, partial [Puccinia striiformis]